MSIETKALTLANNLRFAPESRSRAGHCEKMWRYRSYEGGEPANMIDWKQSARSEKILIREHEPLVHRDIYFWAAPTGSSASEENVALTLLALAYMLVQNERSIGWLGGDLSITATQPLVAPLIQRGMQDTKTRGSAAPPAQPSLRFAFVIIAADFIDNPHAYGDAVKACIAQGNQGLLINVNERGDPAPPLLLHAARNAGWPLFSLGASQKPEDILPAMLSIALQGS